MVDRTEGEAPAADLWPLPDELRHMLPQFRMGYLQARQQGLEIIERLRKTLWEVRRDVNEAADDTIWMRGGIETVVDRITATLGDMDESTHG